ncbi:transcriptional regulator (plasmid) [Rhizobium sp. RCAM05350]|uniref:transcriptional regulator n=1 Tax=Rhizobium sp. RCAM05350 TaxID=2895568 RepID=UPI0020766FC8|nr:transcriptional regulator [Rhizobium sp. RCAM05350]URK89552.1 transcriptional regulator [Rhizobium sp. RCAM05350]
MEKVQRSFAVEYKSGRRRPDPKSNSIWGNMDLKSLALDVEEEAIPAVSDRRLVGKSAGEISLSKAELAALLLTPTIGQHTTAAVKEETTMADEIDTITTTDAPVVVDTPVAPKKQRKPRAKKVALEAASGDAAAEPAIASTDGAGRQKRGRKAKSVDNAGTPKRAPVKRAPREVQTAPAVPAVPNDEMADILQLEEENQRLRKLLAEKLRAENADLRKRLKLD